MPEAEQGRENGPPACDHMLFLLPRSTRDHGHVLRGRCWPQLHGRRLGQYLRHLDGCLPASLSPPRQVSVVAPWLGFSLPS